MNTADQVHKEMLRQANPAKAEFLKRFFKTGPGEYAQGDVFHGITVPQTRKIVAQFKELQLAEVEKLLHSKFHEERLCALIVLVHQYGKANEEQKDRIHALYLKNTKYINNWDLVDTSAGYIVGAHLEHRGTALLKKLARSPLLWDRRIAMIATLYSTVNSNPEPALKIARMLLKDKHDLIHKAVGWMLREVGKRCSEKVLTTFLDQHVHEMPRTALRYALERLPKSKKVYYMAK